MFGFFLFSLAGQKMANEGFKNEEFFFFNNTRHKFAKLSFSVSIEKDALGQTHCFYDIADHKCADHLTVLE
jgi:hypothetical protein